MNTNSLVLVLVHVNVPIPFNLFSLNIYVYLQQFCMFLDFSIKLKPTSLRDALAHCGLKDQSCTRPLIGLMSCL